MLFKYNKYIKPCILILLLIITSQCNIPRQEQLYEYEEGTFTTIDFPGKEGSHLPHLVKDDNDRVYLSWVETKEDTSVLRFSTLFQEEFTNPKNIMSGDDWFVNWADYPMMATHDGTDLLAFWLKMNGEGTYYL